MHVWVLKWRVPKFHWSPKKIIFRNLFFSESAQETVWSCKLHSCRSLPWFRQRSCQVSLYESCSEHSWPGFPQVLSHVFLRRVEDEEVVGGAGERGEVGGVQLQADQQDLPGRQKTGLLKPQGEPLKMNIYPRNMKHVLLSWRFW